MWSQPTPHFISVAPLEPRLETATPLIDMARTALTDANKLSTAAIFDELRDTRVKQDRHAERVLELGRVLEQRGALKGGKDQCTYFSKLLSECRLIELALQRGTRWNRSSSPGWNVDSSS